MRLLTLLASGLLAAALLTVDLPAASAQEQPTTSEGTPVDQQIIPEPDQGQAPDDSGDRGGALQYAVLGLVVVAIGAGVYAVIRESRRKRQDLAGTQR